MKPLSPKMIAIDLDGTLIDSVADLHHAVAAMQRSLGIVPSPVQDVRNWVGNGIERLVHRALTNSMDGAADSELYEQGQQVFHQEYHRINGQFSKVYPAVRENLGWLQNQGIKLICITNKAREFTLPVLDAHTLSSYFISVIAGDDVAHKKPHPESLLKAAEYANTEIGQCLMIGDSVSDVSAAQAAGFGFIGVSYGYNHGQPLRSLVSKNNHIAIIDNFDELRSLI